MEIAILAGGAARRLKGVYKPLLPICGKPLLARVIENTSPFFQKILVVVHTEEQERLVSPLLRKFQVETVILRDAAEVYSPLTGLYTATLHSKNTILTVVPADTPFITGLTLKRLQEALDEAVDAVVPLWPNGYVEPLIAVYRRAVLSEELKRLDRMDIRVASILQRLRTKYIDIRSLTDNPEIEFLNVNTEKDVETAERRCRGQGTS